MSRPKSPSRDGFPWFTALPTRWMDNDLYGHVNNVNYYSYFDTAIANFLIERGGFEPQSASVIGVAVDTACRFHSSVAFPDLLDVGLRIGHLGNSSVRYEIGIFRAAADSAAADGHFVHVFVDRVTQRPAPMPAAIRAAFTGLRGGH